MFKKRTSFNPKRSIDGNPDATHLTQLEKKVRYGGNAEHKRNPGDFGLAPPLGPRPNKTLCDAANICQSAQALKLLREGIRRGLVSRQERNGFPQNIWGLSEDGIPFEAELDNIGTGSYHGYPMPEEDDFRCLVLEKWTTT